MKIEILEINLNGSLDCEHPHVLFLYNKNKYLEWLNQDNELELELIDSHLAQLLSDDELEEIRKFLIKNI